MPPGGSEGLNGPCKMASIARFDDQWNGKAPRAHGVGHSTPGDGPKKTGGHNGCLGRAPSRTASEGKGQIQVEVAYLGPSKKGHKEDKEEDKGGRNTRGHTKYPTRGEVEVLNPFIDVCCRMFQRAEEIGPGQRIDAETCSHNGQGQSHGSSRRLQDQRHGQKSKKEIAKGHFIHGNDSLYDAIKIRDDMQTDSNSQKHQGEVNGK